MTETRLAESAALPEVAVVEAVNLAKVYRRGVEQVRAVDGISFTIRAGEFVAVTGPSGAGKTTLLQLIGAMDVPTTGSIKIMGHELAILNDAELTRLRRDHIGFVFQHFGLMPTLSVAENIALPSTFGGRRVHPPVDQLLEKVGLTKRKDHRPAQLSGGEMQRVAIARALINSPDLLLADEPTGNLDSATSEKIVKLLHTLTGSGLTVVVVTHNEAIAESASRRVRLQDGRIDSED